MPEPGSPNYARAAGRTLLSGGLISGTAAFVAYADGNIVRDGRSHPDVVWVLGVLALVMLAGAMFVYYELGATASRAERRPTQR